VQYRLWDGGCSTSFYNIRIKKAFFLKKQSTQNEQPIVNDRIDKDPYIPVVKKIDRSTISACEAFFDGVKINICPV